MNANHEAATVRRISATCIERSMSMFKVDELRVRLQRSIRLDGPILDLELGRTYIVQAMEFIDSGWWLYLHTVPVSDWPYPYPAEFFSIHADAIPLDWCIGSRLREGQFVVKRLTFAEWASDDGFYEKLIGGDPIALAVYRRHRSDQAAERVNDFETPA